MPILRKSPQSTPVYPRHHSDTVPPTVLFSYIIIRIASIFLSKQHISNVFANLLCNQTIIIAIPDIPKLPVITPNTMEPVTVGKSPSIVMMSVTIMYNVTLIDTLLLIVSNCN